MKGAFEEEITPVPFLRAGRIPPMGTDMKTMLHFFFSFFKFQVWDIAIHSHVLQEPGNWLPPSTALQQYIICAASWLHTSFPLHLSHLLLSLPAVSLHSLIPLLWFQSFLFYFLLLFFFPTFSSLVRHSLTPHLSPHPLPYASTPQHGI